ncbi:MAG: hypothetical protein EP338_13785 [Bacteroidetes bacterium]|nr:MAG: hypothetical protein EP338_13785 [Bacteroidota bacterium]
MKKRIVIPLVVTFLGTIGITQYSYTQENKKRWIDRIKEKNEQNKYKTLTYSLYEFEKLVENNQLNCIIDELEHVHLQIQDVNPFLFKLSLYEMQTNYLISDPSDQNQLEHFQFDEKTLMINVPEINNIYVSETKKIADKNKQGEFNDHVKSLDKLKLMIQNLVQDSIKFSDKRKNLVQKLRNTPDSAENKSQRDQIIKDIDSISDSIYSRIESLQYYRVKLLDVIHSLRDIDQDFILQKEQNHLTTKYVKSIESLKHKANTIQELMIIAHSNKSYNQIDSARRSLINNRFSDSRFIIYNCQKNLDELNNIFSDLKQLAENNPNEIGIQSAYKALLKTHESINQKELMNQFFNLTRLNNAICEENWTIEFTTEKIFDDSDEISIYAIAKPRNNRYGIAPHEIRQHIHFRVEHGVKIDFSSAFVAAIGLNNSSPFFQLLSNTDSTQILRLNEGETKFNVHPTVGLLFNVYRRKIGNHRLTLNFGTATDTDQLFYLAGAGWLMGRSERVGISIGAACRRAEFAKTRLIELNKDQNYDFSNEFNVNSDVPTERKFKMGWYVALTYNFKQKNEDKLKASFKIK